MSNTQLENNKGETLLSTLEKIISILLAQSKILAPSSIIFSWRVMLFIPLPTNTQTDTIKIMEIVIQTINSTRVKAVFLLLFFI
ncbi:MAG TPA: hypothetical protein DDE71_01660 [Tenacibaculum sp.]|nr:hypothetical protein [Tenacibaculum sp.]